MFARMSINAISSRFVPSYNPPSKSLIKEFIKIISEIDKLVVLTGAGVSTESGIPDYRSEGVGQYARTNHRPITIQKFLASEKNRRRYWARNYVAWPRFSSAPANTTHYKLASLERSERFSWMITQNVDGLHTLAGSTKLTELHGCGRNVVCLSCATKYPRAVVQNWITEQNPDWTVKEIGELAPDGDVEIPQAALESFNIPFCPNCGEGSILKTDVVFFGDCVRRSIVDECYDKVDDCTGLLVLGSSLTVMSSMRYVKHASTRRVPILIVNIGPTAGDQLATLKISAKCSEIVSLL